MTPSILNHSYSFSQALSGHKIAPATEVAGYLTTKSAYADLLRQIRRLVPEGGTLYKLARDFSRWAYWKNE